MPGCDHVHVSLRDSHWRLVGTALFVHGGQPWRVNYVVLCNLKWETESAAVAGLRGTDPLHLELSTDADRRWRLNGTEVPAVLGCLDLDLSFSPATNLLPIRRLNLAIGQEATVTAAWLRFPEFTLEPLQQLYHRLTATSYRYEASGGEFTATLQVNEAGFVTDYPGLWRVA